MKTNSIKIFVVLVYTVAALAVFIYEGKVNWLYGGVLAVGNSAGAWFASRWSVEKGDKVVRGQKIAEVRDASPSFLHFEVRDGFDSVDPIPYLN